MLHITFWKNIVRWFVNSNTHFFLDIASSEGMKFTQQEGKYDGRNWSSKFTQQEMMEAPGALPVWVCWSSGGNCGLPKGQGGLTNWKQLKNGIFDLRSGFGKRFYGKWNRNKTTRPRGVSVCWVGAQDVLRDCSFRGKKTHPDTKCSLNFTSGSLKEIYYLFLFRSI